MPKTRGIHSCICHLFHNHSLGMEYQAIYEVLDHVFQGRESTGRSHHSAETVLRTCMVMKEQGLVYGDLTIQISDTHIFALFAAGHRDPSKSALQQGRRWNGSRCP